MSKQLAFCRGLALFSERSCEFPSWGTQFVLSISGCRSIEA
ncbi:hypothetical protein [Bacillus marinisedimentorum]|nr:hypothetical protein [Bacillus marinisedimentorum]